MLGIKSIVSNKGTNIETSRFLKNSISSKRFKIIPKQKKNKITFKKFFKKPSIKYLSIILFIKDFLFNKTH